MLNNGAKPLGSCVDLIYYAVDENEGNILRGNVWRKTKNDPNMKSCYKTKIWDFFGGKNETENENH